MKKNILLTLAVATIPFLSSCSTTNYDYDLLEEKITIAKVQKEIKIGMSSSAVIENLGSPNMVTTDAERRETWVYDRFATREYYYTSGYSNTHAHNNSSFGSFLWGSWSGSGLSSTNQRALTIIIKFDKNGLVRDLAYKLSNF